MIRKLGHLLVAGFLGGSVGIATAQEPLLGQYFGSGVHAFNNGHYLDAQKDLTAAIDAGTKDPRCYYYRGLAFLRSGLEKDAIADFQKGAELETADVNQMFPVGRSLERVQGRERVTLENYRAQARMANFARQQKERETRYQARKRAEDAVMRKIPAEETPLPKAGIAAPPKAAPGADPFGSEPATKPEAPAGKGGSPAPDPFGGGAADPFGGATKPADPPKAGDAAPDPFGDTTKPPPKAEPAKDDPPKADPPKADPPKADPPKADPPKAAPGDDPFGGNAAPEKPIAEPAKVDPPKADPPKAAPGDDPFGGVEVKPNAPVAASGGKVTTKGLLGVFGSMVNSMVEDDGPKAAGPQGGPGFDLSGILGAGGKPAPQGDVPVAQPRKEILPDQGPAVTPKKDAGDNDPFGVPAVAPKKEAPPADDPFSGPEMPKKPEAKDDPFKDDAAPLTPKAAGGAKPEPKPADDDPFGS